MPTLLDFEQVIKAVYDEPNNRLRVDMGATINLAGELEVAIDAASGDNIAISDGTDTLAINPDGSINVTLAGTGGTPQYAYSEVTSVPSSSLTTIVSYTALNDGKIKLVSGSGTNIGTFIVQVNGVTKDTRRTMFGGNLNVDFNFSDGFLLSSGDVVTLRVTHERPYVGDFSGKIQVLED